MPNQDSGSLIPSQHGSFTGASVIDFTSPWDLTRSPTEPNELRLMTFGWQQMTGGARFSHAVCFDPTGFSDEPQKLVLRIICHVLLNCVPDAGLPETIESLVEISRYYDFLAQTREEVSHKPSPVTLSARLGKTLERPVFPISDE